MTTPAGWYDDGSGRQRWWDGQQWTEHFAPETAASTEPETPASAEVPAVDETVTAPEAQDASETSTTPADHSDQGAADAPETIAPTTPLGDDLGASSAAAAPVYPVAAPGQPASGYPGSAPAYPGTPSGYPAAGPYGQPGPEAPKKLSVLGLVGLGLSVVGTILVFIPLIGFVGFILLAAGFVVSLISLFLKGKKWPGITGLALAVVGTIIGVVMSFVYLLAVAQGVSSEIDNLPSSSPSIEATAPSGTDGTDDAGARPTPAEVAVGLTAILNSTAEGGYTEPQVTCLSELIVASDLDNATVRAIAESDGTFTDPDVAYAFAEVLGDTEAVTACFAP